MFKLKRKKGQGAIEYLFMIAAALVIILIAVRYVSDAGSQASNQGDLAMLQSQVETIKAQLEAQDKDLTSIKPDDTNTFEDLYKDCMRIEDTISDKTSSESCKVIIDWWNNQ